MERFLKVFNGGKFLFFRVNLFLRNSLKLLGVKFGEWGFKLGNIILCFK